MAGRDGGQSKSAGRGPRAGEMTTTLLTVSVTAVFLQSLTKFIDGDCRSVVDMWRDRNHYVCFKIQHPHCSKRIYTVFRVCLKKRNFL